MISALFDDLLDGILDGVLPEGGWLSMPSIAAALAAFGATGFILQQADFPIGAAIGAGAAVALVCGAVAVRLGLSFSRIASDGTPTKDDIVGTVGRVVTAVAAGSTGEVLITLAGQPVKLTARSLGDEELSTGAEIVVVSVESPTRVTVQEAAGFWGGPTAQKDQT